MAGIDTMFLTILRSMGFDPAEITRQVTEFAASIQAGLAKVDTRFTSIENKLDKILDRLDDISPQIPFPVSGVDETLSAVVVPFSATITQKDAA